MQDTALALMKTPFFFVAVIALSDILLIIWKYITTALTNSKGLWQHLRYRGGRSLLHGLLFADYFNTFSI